MFVRWVVEFEGDSVRRMLDMLGRSRCSSVSSMERWQSLGRTVINWIVDSMFDVIVHAEVPSGCRYGGRVRFRVGHEVFEPPHLKPRESISNRVMCTIDVFE